MMGIGTESWLLRNYFNTRIIRNKKKTKNMKKFFNLLFVMFFVVGLTSCASTSRISNKLANDSRVEIVNEQTVIFRDVVKIEIFSNNPTQITYVYDLDHSTNVKVARGSFNVELKRGDYLIQSNRKITKTLYDVIIE
jgi:hypothetical protein